MEGFFATSVLKQSKPPISRVPSCGACGLFKLCKSPKMPVSGAGKKKILIVGEGPGKNEDLEGKPFVGTTGQLLERTLRQLDINMRRDCWITNAVICHPWKMEDGKKVNREPSSKELDYCRPNLINAIEDLEPEIIIPLGEPAVTSLIGWLYKDNPGGIGKWIGWRIPHQRLNTWICPAWHPSFVAREGFEQYTSKVKNPVVVEMWKDHLRKATRLQGRPWEQIPDYNKEISIVHSPNEAAKIIRRMILRTKVAAFDYETNMLKPDWPDARIVSASICFDGKLTIAFPWMGEAVVAMSEFLRSKIKKIASNLKFEERWTRKFLQHRVRNWWWDTMLGAHIHDNRAEITGLKFQSFVWFGVESYNDHIKPLLQSKGNERTNQVLKEVDLNDLLLYNGLDSFLEFKVCFKQRKAMGYIK